MIFFMANERKYFVTYGTTVVVEDTVTTDIAELKKLIHEKVTLENLTLLHVLETKELEYEVISEDKTGQDQVSGDTHRGPETDNGVGATGKQEGPEDRKEVQGHEQGAGERNDSGQASTAGKASEDRVENEGRLSKD